MTEKDETGNLDFKPIRETIIPSGIVYSWFIIGILFAIVGLLMQLSYPIFHIYNTTYYQKTKEEQKIKGKKPKTP